MSNLGLLSNSRKYIRGQVTRNFNNVDAIRNLVSADRLSKLAKFKGQLADLKSLDEKIQSLKWAEEQDASKLTDEFETCDSYSEKLNYLIAVLETNQTPSTTQETVEAARSLLKSPIAPLPTFKSEEGENFEKFIAEFEDTVKVFKYTDRDKLLLLKQQVSGRASILLKSLETDKQTYADAKKLLQSALASPIVQKFSLIKQIVEMKLTYRMDPFSYIGQMKNVMEGVKLLKIQSEDFLNYFFWTGLNDTFQTQLTNITNKTRPSLDDINDNFFDACERYAVVVKKFESQKSFKKLDNFKSVSLATNVNFEDNKPRVKCPLCSYDGKLFDHHLNKCKNFISPTSKIEILNQLEVVLSVV